MDEYNFCEEIRKKYNIEKLKSKTLEYRINGFVYACNMNLKDGLYTRCLSTSRLPYINIKKEDEEINYNINFTLNHDRVNGNCAVIIGKYNDLSLYFANYYDQDRRKDRVNEIPFQITIGKMYHEYSYQLDIRVMSDSRIKFAIKRDKEGEMFPSIVVFAASINDFSKILKLVKSFVYNPDLVFVAYDSIVNSKEVVFTIKDLNAALVEDEKLDKPQGIVGKILKKLTNND